MFTRKKAKTVLILLIVVLMVATVVFAACNKDEFKPLEKPKKGDVTSNGGSAVRYGDYIYYVNGNESSVDAENTYVNVDARIGAVARIKVEDLEKLFEVYDSSLYTTSSARTEEIEKRLKATAQIVVPNIYYSGNTTSTHVNGIFIFNDRLYILTPNDELTAGGNKLTSQNVLTSYELDGSDPVRHYVFTDNTAQVALREVNGKLYALYIMGTEVGCVDVKDGKAVVIVKETSGATLDIADNSVVYIREKSICKLRAGATEAKTLVNNEGGKDSTVTYTISGVNNGYVYYTKADSESSSTDNNLYYVTESATDLNNQIALATTAPSTYYGYKNTIVYTKTFSVQGTTLYGVYLWDNVENKAGKVIVDPAQSNTSITFNRLEGDVLYYTSNSVAYTVDLSADKPESTPYGRSLASASGWAAPDIVGEYVITVSSGSISAVKFDAEKKTNSSSVSLTLKVPEEENDD